MTSSAEPASTKNTNTTLEPCSNRTDKEDSSREHQLPRRSQGAQAPRRKRPKTRHAHRVASTRTTPSIDGTSRHARAARRTPRVVPRTGTETCQKLMTSQTSSSNATSAEALGSTPGLKSTYKRSRRTPFSTARTASTKRGYKSARAASNYTTATTGTSGALNAVERGNNVSSIDECPECGSALFEMLTPEPEDEAYEYLCRSCGTITFVEPCRLCGDPCDGNYDGHAVCLRCRT